MDIDWKLVGGAVATIVGVMGGGYAGHESNVSEVEACGVLLQQQREGFATTLRALQPHTSPRPAPPELQ